MTTLLVNLSGSLLVAAIVWWFWLYRRGPAAQPRVGVIQVSVENGVYRPERIRVPLNQPTRLRFVRRAPSACAATVVFDELEISAELPLGEARDVVITPAAPGQYRFGCPMQMYRGTLEVTDA